MYQQTLWGWDLLNPFLFLTEDTMKEYKVEKVAGMGLDSKATEIMNKYAAQGRRVLRTEVLGSYHLVIFERDK